MTSEASFRQTVWRYYRAHGRHDLPWRKTHDLYKILVSEVMLQQTQVERVVPFYTIFIKQFPTARRLAAASLSDVLKAWQGLGYNRRAKMLHAAAKMLADRKTRSDLVARSDLVLHLEDLPGVGPYTARAVAAFAYNENTIVIETNIRTAVIHHFFADTNEKVADADIAEILERILPRDRAREWYSALMDYGAYLKQSGVSHNTRTKGYTKQSKFAGSLRQVRGAILRNLATRSNLVARLDLVAAIRQELGDNRREQINRAFADLLAEELIQKEKGKYRLAP